VAVGMSIDSWHSTRPGASILRVLELPARNDGGWRRRKLPVSALPIYS
jgi:hypothetical protein